MGNPYEKAAGFYRDDRVIRDDRKSEGFGDYFRDFRPRQKKQPPSGTFETRGLRTTEPPDESSKKADRIKKHPIPLSAGRHLPATSLFFPLPPVPRRSVCYILRSNTRSRLSIRARSGRNCRPIRSRRSHSLRA